MKMIGRFALILLAASAFAPHACVAEENRIAVISMDRVFDKHRRTGEANAQLKARAEEMDKERDTMTSKAKALKAELDELSGESLDSSLSEAEQKRIREQAKRKYEDFMDLEERLLRFDRVSKNELSVKMRDAQQEIVADIRKVIEGYVKSKHIALVIDRSGKTMNGVEAVVYFESAIDITDDIIALLGEKKSEK